MKGQSLSFDATPEELKLFMSEGEEQLELLSTDILRLEQEGDGNTELLQEIFRAAHTLKGSSGAIGHQRMARLTHAAESVLDQVRHHQLPVSTVLVDLLLKTLDALRVLLDEVASGVASEISIDEIVGALGALAQGQTPAPSTTPPPPAAPPQAAAPPPNPTSAPSSVVSADDLLNELQVWQVITEVDPRCALPAARALQIVLACGQVGTVVNSEPLRDAIEAGNVAVGATVTVWLSPLGDVTEATIRQRLDRIPEVSIRSIGMPNGQTIAAPAPQHWQIEVAIDSNCAFAAPRALQVLLACTRVGAIISSEPSPEAIDRCEVPAGTHVAITFATDRPAAEVEATLKQLLHKVAEITLVRLAPSSEFATAPVITPAPTVGSTPAAPDHLAASATPAAGLATTPDHPAKGPAEHGPEAEPVRSNAPRMVRIDVERLDALMNLIGELVIGRTRLARIGTTLSGKTDDLSLIEDLTETSRHIARISDDLQDQVMRSRMLPIESVFSKFPRLVRDLALKVDKKVDFVVEGKDTELDRSVAEQIGDPIIHLLRNAVDHGLETPADRHTTGKNEVGQLRLAARHEENQIIIDVEDDGRGIVPEKIKNKAISKGLLTAEAASRLSERETVELIFAPGFSTAEQVSDLSGRGVGMDIVRTNIERLNGSVTVETEPGQGSRFTIRLPLTLAIIRALLVDVTGQVFAIPLTAVVEALRIQDNDLYSINSHEAIQLRGQVLPLVRLSELFRGNTAPDAQAPEAVVAGRQFVVAIRWGERRVGLIVDSLVGEQEIVIKPLGQLFRNAVGIAGGAVLGDGQVAPILDVASLIKQVMAKQGLGLAPKGALV